MGLEAWCWTLLASNAKRSDADGSKGTPGLRAKTWTLISERAGTGDIRVGHDDAQQRTNGISLLEAASTGRAAQSWSASVRESRHFWRHSIRKGSERWTISHGRGGAARPGSERDADHPSKQTAQ